MKGAYRALASNRASSKKLSLTSSTRNDRNAARRRRLDTCSIRLLARRSVDTESAGSRRATCDALAMRLLERSTSCTATPRITGCTRHSTASTTATCKP